MNIAYDLHIHSSLSPCADNDMTPNNIVNMSVLKGLDVIAVTDHNSCANVQACAGCAQNAGLLVIPGMEAETAEEIHAVCLFPDIKSAFLMQELVYSRLPQLKNREDIFGEQLVLDQNDQLIRKEEQLLLAAASITINELFHIVNDELHGLVIPAHIDRQSNSILSVLGVLPPDIDISCVEIGRRNAETQLADRNPELGPMKKIYSSDAHQLGNINERENFLEVEELSARGVIEALRRK